MASPELSAVVVLGPVRDRAQRVVDAICEQTVSERMRSCSWTPPTTRRRACARTAPPRSSTSDGLRRLPGARREPAESTRRAGPSSRSSRNHCIPSPDWAEALVDAHRGPWAAVGYAFGNANPASYVSRASFVVDYGTWAKPTVSGETGLLQSNNISYKRELLEAIGEPLDELLETDWNVQQALKADGHRLYLEGRAVAFHYNFTSVREMLDENFAHCRAIAAGRREREDWGACAAPRSRSRRRSSRRRSALRVSSDAPRGDPGQRAAVARALPLIALVYPYAALGEAIGYARGLGATDRALRRSLLDTRRESAPTA